MKTPAKRRLWLAKAESRVQRASRLTPLLVFAAMIVVAGLVFIALRLANQLWIASYGEAEMVIKPVSISWLLIAVPIGFTVGALLWPRINTRILGPPPTRFSANYVLASMSTPVWFSVSAWIVLVLFAFVGWLNIRKHVRLTELGIQDQRALALQGHFYPYRAVIAVEMSHHWQPGWKGSRGGPSRQRVLFIYFRDGKRWSLVDSELGEDERVNADVANRIARHTGLTIRYPDRIVDAPTRRGHISAFPSILLLSSSALLLWLARRARRKKS